MIPNDGIDPYANGITYHDIVTLVGAVWFVAGVPLMIAWYINIDIEENRFKREMNAYIAWMMNHTSKRFNDLGRVLRDAGTAFQEVATSIYRFVDAYKGVLSGKQEQR